MVPDRFLWRTPDRRPLPDQFSTLEILDTDPRRQRPTAANQLQAGHVQPAISASRPPFVGVGRAHHRPRRPTAPSLRAQTIQTTHVQSPPPSFPGDDHRRPCRSRALARDSRSREPPAPRRAPAISSPNAITAPRKIFYSQLSKARPGLWASSWRSAHHRGTDKSNRFIVARSLDGTLNFLHCQPHYCVQSPFERGSKAVRRRRSANSQE